MSQMSLWTSSSWCDPQWGAWFIMTPRRPAKGSEEGLASSC